MGQSRSKRHQKNQEILLLGGGVRMDMMPVQELLSRRLTILCQRKTPMLILPTIPIHHACHLHPLKADWHIICESDQVDVIEPTLCPPLVIAVRCATFLALLSPYPGPPLSMGLAWRFRQAKCS